MALISSFPSRIPTGMNGKSATIYKRESKRIYYQDLYDLYNRQVFESGFPDFANILLAGGGVAFSTAYINAYGKAAEECWKVGLTHTIHNSSALMETAIWVYDTRIIHGRVYEYQLVFYS